MQSGRLDLSFCFQVDGPEAFQFLQRDTSDVYLRALVGSTGMFALVGHYVLQRTLLKLDFCHLVHQIILNGKPDQFTIGLQTQLIHDSSSIC